MLRNSIVPFQGGFDGFAPNRTVLTGQNIVAGNMQGLDLSSATAPGTIAFQKSNQRSVKS